MSTKRPESTYELIDHLQREREHLRTRNAELLAALRRAQDNIDTLGENLRAGFTRGGSSLVERFLADVNAAIAKAEKGE